MNLILKLFTILILMGISGTSFGQWADPGTNPHTANDPQIQNVNPDLEFDCTSTTGNSGLEFQTNGSTDGYLIFNHELDQWDFTPSQIGGTVPWFCVQDAGQVGINVINPLAELHVKSTTGSHAEIRMDGSTHKYIEFYEGPTLTGFMGHGGTDMYISNFETNGNIILNPEREIQFRSNGTQRMTMTSSGNLGIGTDSPSTRLHIEGGGIYLSNGFPWFDFNTTSSGDSWGGHKWNDDGNTVAYSYFNEATSSFHWQNGSFNSTGINNALTVDVDLPNVSGAGDGIVSVGPLDAQHITLDNNEVQSKSGGAPSSLFLNYFGGATFINSSGASNSPVIIGNDHEIYVDNLNANVGIGTSSPDRKLEVLGQVLVSNLNSYPSSKQSTFLMRHYDQPGTHFAYFKAQSSDTQNSVIFGGGAGANYAATSVTFYTGATTTTLNGNERMRIRNDGKVRVGAASFSYDFNVDGSAGKPGGGDWSTLSDRRVKTGIRKFEDGLEQVLQINPVYFQYKEGIDRNSGKEYVGIIAQEMQEVAPYTIEEVEVAYEEGDKRNIDMESVLAYDGTAVRYMLVNAVKELASQNQQIVQENKELIQKIDKLNKNNDAMNDRLNEIENILRLNEASVNMDDIHKKDIVLGQHDKAFIGQNHPNPFNDQTIIKYYIPEGAKNANISIFNEIGQLLKSIEIDEFGEGQINLKANALPAGSYSYQLNSDSQIIGSRTMILAR